MTARPFIKMHGLGNDFVVVDARREPFVLDEATARAIADRRFGVGCDQLIVMEPPSNGAADVFMRIRNADGGEVSACGNAARCVARLLFEEGAANEIVLETAAGLLTASPANDDGELYTVDMGPARDGWQDIPLAEACDTDHLPLARGPLADPVGVNMGNPHAVFFVADASAIAWSPTTPRPFGRPPDALARSTAFARNASRHHWRRIWPPGLKASGWTPNCCDRGSSIGRADATWSWWKAPEG